ncbi:baculoviral IAP repeat-containing protein 7 isoform 1-T1 [Hipposideros larvatus]
MLAATLAPSGKRRSPRLLPNLGHCPALFSLLFEAKATADPRSPGACRVGTFQDWLSRGLVTAAELVSAGLSSMEPEDTTQCWGWSPELCRWAARGSPTRGHCVPHTLCGHVLGRDAGSALSWGGQDHVDGQILGQLKPLMEEEEEAGAGAAPSARPAFPEMSSHELRLASFYDWPLTAVVRPELLAAAGFFHTGQQDKVRCFFCYGGLQSWEQGDDPWTEHAKWFPRCKFLLQTKGRDFVCSVQESYCHLLSSWLLSTRALSCPCPEERPSWKVPGSQPGTQRSSFGACGRRGPARCAWTAPWALSSCPAATWSVPSVHPTCSSAPSAGPLFTAACAPSCPKPGAASVASVWAPVHLSLSFGPHANRLVPDPQPRVDDGAVGGLA